MIKKFVKICITYIWDKLLDNHKFNQLLVKYMEHILIVIRVICILAIIGFIIYINVIAKLYQ
jgi:hypothetical protein